jgi:membrane-associated protease RseP (regulator of RpoE activity)
MSESSSPLPVSSFEPSAIPVFVVARRPQRYWLHALLFLLTVGTTLAVGARMQFEFAQGLPAFSADADFLPFAWIWEHPARLLMGLPFSVTLMLILLCHELGHYFYCVRYRVDATLPFFLPAPTPIGTLGAFIRIRAPIRSRRALFDIGIAGPLAGFVVAMIALVVSLALSRPSAAGTAESQLPIGMPLVFHLVHRATVIGQAGFVPLDHILLHPMAIAAWVGMFATALNLLPGGQLDGGHIVFALWPNAHRWVSRFTILALIPMGLLLWSGWLIWAALLTLSGTRHPPVGRRYFGSMGFSWLPAEDWEPLGTTRYGLAALVAIILVLTFLPVPFPGAGVPADAIRRLLHR